MSFGVFRKLPRCLGISAFLWLAMPTASRAQEGCAPVAASFGVPCGVGCQSHHCPPAFPYCVEGPPRIHWKHGCPRPVCNPCDLPHWGFYETCWNPWPFPPDWTHCSSAPPASFVTLDAYGRANLPAPGRTAQPGRTFRTEGAVPSPVFPMSTPPSGTGNPQAPSGGFEDGPLLPPPRRIDTDRPAPNQ